MAAGEGIRRVCCLAMSIQLVLVLEPLGSVGEDQFASCCTDNDWMYKHDCSDSCSTNGMDRHCCCSGYSVDEFESCIDECEAGTHDCEHNCHNTPESYYCSCDEGYQLANDNRSCLNISECTENCMPGTCINTTGFYNCSDVDECLVDNGGCNHICNNAVGSYHCECYHGYRLGEDEHNCISVVDPGGGNSTSLKIIALAAGIPGGLTVCVIIVIIVSIVFVMGCIHIRKKKSRRPNILEGNDNPTYQGSIDACNIMIEVSSGDPIVKDDLENHIYEEIKDTHRPTALTPSELTTSQNINTSQLEVLEVLVRSRYETSEECLLSLSTSLDRPVVSNHESLDLEEKDTSDEFVMTDKRTEKNSNSKINSSTESEELNSSSDSEDELENPITIRPQITSEKGSTILMLNAPPAVDTEDFAMEDQPRRTSSLEFSLHTSAGLDPSLHSSTGLDPSLHSSTGLDPSLHSSTGLDPSLHSSAGLDPSSHSSAGLDPSLHSSAGLDPSLHSSTGLDPSLHTSTGLDPSLHSSAGLDPSLHMYAVLESRTEEAVSQNHCSENDTYSHLNHNIGSPKPVTAESCL